MAEGSDPSLPTPEEPAAGDSSTDDLSAFRPGDRHAFPGFWPPPPPRPSVFRRLILPLFLCSLVFGSLALNFVLLFGSPSEDANVTTQVIFKGESPKLRVAVVTIAGEIDSALSARVDHELDRVERDVDVKALVIEIETPGGEVTASDEIYDRLLRYKARRSAAGRSPLVVASMKSQATSGGYYIACAADHIFAEPTTLTGNIGVLMPRYNVSGLMQKFGVQETTVVATGADFKHVGSPFQPETKETEAYLRSRIDEAFARFKQVVTAGRGTKIAGHDVFNGKIFTASEAVSFGLVDQVGYPLDAYAYAGSKNGIGNPQVMRYKEAGLSLLGMALGGASASAGGNGPVNSQPGGMVNGITFPTTLRPELLDALRTNRLLYR